MLASTPSAARANPGPRTSGTLNGAAAPDTHVDTPSPRVEPGEGKERLTFDGFPTPIVVDVVDRDEDGLTLQQALPFLALDGLLTDSDGRRATLASVGITVREGVPHLELEVRFTGSDDPTVDLAARLFPADGPSGRRDATVPYAIANPDIQLEIQLDASDVPATPMTPLASPAGASLPWYKRVWLALRRLAG